MLFNFASFNRNKSKDFQTAKKYLCVLFAEMKAHQKYYKSFLEILNCSYFQMRKLFNLLCNETSDRISKEEFICFYF